MTTIFHSKLDTVVLSNATESCSVARLRSLTLIITNLNVE